MNHEQTKKLIKSIDKIRMNDILLYAFNIEMLTAIALDLTQRKVTPLIVLSCDIDYLKPPIMERQDINREIIIRIMHSISKEDQLKILNGVVDKIKRMDLPNRSERELQALFNILSQNEGYA